MRFCALVCLGILLIVSMDKSTKETVQRAVPKIKNALACDFESTATSLDFLEVKSVTDKPLGDYDLDHIDTNNYQ